MITKDEAPRLAKHFTPDKMHALIQGAKSNRHGHRDAAMIPLAVRHGLRASTYGSANISVNGRGRSFTIVPNGRYGAGYRGCAMTFLYGIFVGWVVAWAPGLLLMWYLTWKASRDRAPVRTNSEGTSQSGRAKVLGSLRPSPRTR
jgi:hypothetical protein